MFFLAVSQTDRSSLCKSRGTKPSLCDKSVERSGGREIDLEKGWAVGRCGSIQGSSPRPIVFPNGFVR